MRKKVKGGEPKNTGKKKGTPKEGRAAQILVGRSAADDERFEEEFVGGIDHVSEPKWKPGVVEVEFEDPEIPRRMIVGFRKPAEPVIVIPTWPDGISKILSESGEVTWRRTFPLSYSWSTDEELSPNEESIQANRDRFVTFNFSVEADVVRIAEELREQPEIAWATALPGILPASPFTEPLLGPDDQVNEYHLNSPTGWLQNQWYIFRCRVNQSWKLTSPNLSGQGVVIADVDWGCDSKHQDLNIELEFNSIESTSGPGSASNGTKKDHGTAALGLAGGRSNTKGMVGVAYEAALWAIQGGDELTNEPCKWAEAIEYVRKTDGKGRRKVMILEVQTENRGNIEMFPQIRQAIIDAIGDKVVVCVPAGNAGRDADLADDKKTTIPETGSILVGATIFDKDSNKNPRGKSNYGKRVVVYAPGDSYHDVTCDNLFINGYRNVFGGTSGAVAKIAGVAALMLQANQTLEHDEIRDILKNTATPTVTDDPSNSGVFVNAEAAVCEAIKRAGGLC